MILDFTRNDSKTQIIETDKKRPFIFKANHKKVSFDDIYNNPIFNELSFLNSDNYDSCQCQNTLEQCPKLIDVLKDIRKQQAHNIYENLKYLFVIKSQRIPHDYQQTSRLPQQFKFQSKILEPYFNNLKRVIDTKDYEPIALILKHIKTQYQTFWIYSLFISKWPTYQEIKDNILTLIKHNNFMVNLDALQGKANQLKSNKLQFAYDKKLANIFQMSYPVVLKLILENSKSKMIIQKLLICFYVSGRNRSEAEIINAAMDL